MRAALLPAVALLALWSAPADAGERFTDLRVEADFNDNVLNAHAGPDIRSDRITRLAIAHGRYRDLGRDAGLSLAVTLASDTYADFTTLDLLSPGVAIGYRKKAGIGYYAPRLTLDLTAERLLADRAMRTGSRFRARAGAERWLRRRLKGKLFAEAERRTADNAFVEGNGDRNAVYALGAASAGVSLDYHADERTVLTVGASRRRGDVVVLASYLTAAYHDPAWYPTDEFGPRFWGYRLNGAVTDAWNLGVSRALDPRTTLNVGLERQVTRRGALRYDAGVIRLAVARNF